MDKFFMKLHKSGGKSVLAACDSWLLGKKFSEGAVVLDLENSRGFYEGEETSDEGELVRAIQEADSANLVGELCISAAQSAGMAKESDAVKIAGVPHLQIYRRF